MLMKIVIDVPRKHSVIYMVLRSIYYYIKGLNKFFLKTFYGFLMTNKLSFAFSNDITLKHSVLFNNETKFPHPVGMVIGEGVNIGKQCIIYQNVTIGTKDGLAPYPKIGNNVTIYAGACIIGAVEIGNRVVVGANSVVLSDVPDDSIVVGMPARVIRKI